MKYQPNKELFDTIESLQQDFSAARQEDAGNLISEGMRGLNGLTDGWAYLLEHLNLVIQKHGDNLSPQQSTKLLQIQNTVHKAVYRA